MRQKPGPVPTIYKNQRFRSRQEAQWAAFLDDLAVGWQYQLFALGSAYLPDFWFPTYRVWGEVQTDWPGEKAIEGMELLVHQTDNPLILFKGPPPLPSQSGENGKLAYCLAKPLGWGFTQVAFCKKCESVVFMFIWRESEEKKSVLLPPQCPCCGYLFDAPPPERLVTDPLLLRRALIAAHSADFEPAR